MSSLDLYDDAENLISSDEYSEEDDDELMNAAISTHHNRKPELPDRYYHRQTQSPRPPQKRAPLAATKANRPPFKRKLCSRYKARAMKWLNGKAKREKSKQYLLCLKRKENSRIESHKFEKPKKVDEEEDYDDDDDDVDDEEEEDIVLADVDDCRENKKPNNLSDPIELDESDIEYSSPIKCTDNIKNEPKEETIYVSKIKVEKNAESTPKVDIQEKPMEFDERKKELMEKQKQLDDMQREIDEKHKQIAERQAMLDEKQKVMAMETDEKSVAATEVPPKEAADNTKSQKRPRSISPIPTPAPAPTSETEATTKTTEKEKEKEGNDSKRQQFERSNSTQLYRELNEMFPKYDEVIGNHVKHNSTTIDAIDENMTRLMQDIQTLNDLLQAKETEWNRLLNLKRVKEEILNRLARKKHILSIDDRKYDEKYKLQTLKEVEMYLAETQPQNTTGASANALGLSTVHQLIENRASMKTDELQRERNNTTRLQNILISSNILQRSKATTSNYDMMETVKNQLSPPIHHSTAATYHNRNDDDDDHPELPKYQYLEEKMKFKAGRQGPLIDVKSIVADFRQQHPNVFPRVGKRIKAAATINDIGYQMRGSPTNCVDGPSVYMDGYNGSITNYAPTLEKLLSTTTRNSSNNNHSLTQHHIRHGAGGGGGAMTTQGFKFNMENQKNLYRLQSDDGCNEISITPVNCINNRYGGGQRGHQNQNATKAGLLRTALDVNAQHQNDYYDIADYIKASNNHKSMRDVRHSSSSNNNNHHSDAQLCQECKMSEARFVCAGCGNQWYCSRECQVNAWDKHSEVCSD